MYLKNDTPPKPIYAILVNASDGSPITTGVTAYHIQGTTRTTGQGTLTHIANGRWAYTPTQAETNYDAFAIDFYHASAVGQGALVEVVTATQGIALITADTSAIKAKTDAYLDATVSSRLAASGYTAPDNASISAIKATVDANLDAPISSRAPASTALSNAVWTNTKAGYLDAAISSRLAGSAYTAPDNVSIAAIKTTVDANLDATVSSRAPAATALSNVIWTDAKAGYLDSAISSRLAAADYTAPDNTSIASIKTTVDWTLDAAISTRLAAASYTAPDNASIAAIKAKTDKLTFNEDNYVYAVGVGGSGGTDWTDTEKQQIRYRLGIDGSTQAPSTNSPHLGSSYSTLDDLAAHVSTRLAASSYIAPDNASIAAIKSQTDKLSFVGSDVKATLDNEQVTVAVNNDKTGYSLTADYDRAKTALAITEYLAPDNASIAAIKAKTDKLTFNASNQVIANAANLDNSAIAIEINAEDVAAAIWDVGMSEHNIPGSAGAKLNVIEARTANITAGTEINVVQPVAQDQTLTLVRGDDYSAADGRALQWTGYFPDLTGATITFTIASRRDYQAIVQATCTAAPGTEGAWTVTAELTSAQTSLLNPYDTSYVYDVEAVIDSRHVTLVRGRVEVLPDANRT